MVVVHLLFDDLLCSLGHHLAIGSGELLRSFFGHSHDACPTAATFGLLLLGAGLRCLGVSGTVIEHEGLILSRSHSSVIHLLLIVDVVGQWEFWSSIRSALALILRKGLLVAARSGESLL